MSFDRLEVRLDPGTSRGVRAGDGQDRRLVVHHCYVKLRRCMKDRWIGKQGLARLVMSIVMDWQVASLLRDGRRRRRVIARRIQFRKQKVEVRIRKVDVRKHETAEIEFIVLRYYGESIVIDVALWGDLDSSESVLDGSDFGLEQQPMSCFKSVQPNHTWHIFIG
jgi:hypothetical protein